MTAPDPNIVVIQRAVPAEPTGEAQKGHGDDSAGNPTTGMAVALHAVPVEDGPASESEGGEPPSHNQETTEQAGTDSSASSNPDENSESNSEKQTPEAAHAAAVNSGPAAKTESSGAGSTDGSGTGQ